MTTYGITENGFIRKPIDVIISELEDAFKGQFGLNVNLSAGSVFGQILGLYADRENALWELLEDIFYSQYRDTASGIALDNAVRLIGLTRRAAEKSKGFLPLVGTNGVTVPAGVRFKEPTNLKLFELQDDVTIDNTNVGAGLVILTAGYSGITTYTVTVNGVSYSSVGELDIYDTFIAIRNQINTADVGVLASVGLKDGNYYLYIVSSVESDDTFDTFTLAVTNLTVAWVGTLGIWECTETGANDINDAVDLDIQNPVSGWTEVYAATYVEISSTLSVPYLVVGRAVETDAELRIRAEQSIKLPGKATLDAINADLLAELPGLIYGRCYENYTDLTDSDGRPPHSIELVVQGSLPSDVGSFLWENKPAGIQTHGSQSVEITDDNGDKHTLYYTPVASLPVYIKVTITEYDEEELPSSYETLIKEAVLAYGNALGVGVDVIPTRFFGGIYAACSGLATITVERSTDGAIYSAALLPVDYNERAAFTTARVSVIK